MRLRVSGQQTGHKYQLGHIMDGNSIRSGLPNGNVLNAFVESIIGRNEAGISVARATIISELGEQALVDAAATIAAFNAYPRMADSTGIPLEDAKKEITMEIREELGMETLWYEE
jgi:hypothetical protein